MSKIRSGTAPFKTYRDLARRLHRDGRLILPRPERCLRCRCDCGFVRDGHYFRDFIFRHTVVSHVGVQRYLCKDTEGGTFSALAAFQEPHAHYTVDVRGEALHRVFVNGQSKRSAWREIRKIRGSRCLARSSVSTWCRRFRKLAARHAAALGAHLARHLPTLSVPIRGDPKLFLAAARAALGIGILKAFPPGQYTPGEVGWG